MTTHSTSLGALMTLVLCAALGCGSTSIATNYDRWATFDRYASFSIEPGPIRNDGGFVGGPSELVQRRIDGALGSQLSARGLEPAARQRADLIVTYAASEGDRQELVRGRTGPLSTGSYAGRAIWVQEYREARLVIDVIDANSQKIVWRATARGMNQKLQDPAFIQHAIELALAEFPRGLGPARPAQAKAGATPETATTTAAATTTGKGSGMGTAAAKTASSLNEQEPGGG